MSNPRLRELTAMKPYRVALEESKTKSAKAPMTIDERYDADLTFLQQTYGAQEERDNAAHKAAVEAQEEARLSANRQEYISHELMQKYLPRYQAMRGTGGMGTSATDATAAYNAYLGRVSGNNASYAKNVAELDRQKAETDYLREAERRKMEHDLKKQYDDERQAAVVKESDGLLGILTDRAMRYRGTDDKFSQEDYDNLVSFYEANKFRFTEEDKRNAQDMLVEYRQAVREGREQTAMDRDEFTTKGITYSRGLSDYGKVGNNFWVKDANGAEYAVELGEEIVDGVVLGQAKKADSGEVFSYGGNLYLKKDQKVYAVNRREQTKHDEYESLYNLYMGRDGQSGQQAVPQDTRPGTSSMSTEQEVFRSGENVRVKNQNGEAETVLIGEKVDHPFSPHPYSPTKYMEVGVIYDVNGERLLKDASGVVYKVK